MLYDAVKFDHYSIFKHGKSQFHSYNYSTNGLIGIIKS